MMEGTVVLVHGLNASSKHCFLPKAKEELESHGLSVIASDYPNPADPDYEEWRQKFLSDLHTQWKGGPLIIVGHSLGGYFILRLIGDSVNEPWTKEIRGILTVGGTTTLRPTHRMIYAVPINWEAILSFDPWVVVLYSTDDQRISSEHPQFACEQLRGLTHLDYVETSGYGHFILTEAPIVVQKILDFLRR